MFNNKNKKQILMFALPILLVIIVLGYAGYKSGIGGTAGKTGSTGKSNSAASAALNSAKTGSSSKNVPSNPAVTYENYLKIKLGMTYDNVKSILGEGTKKELKSGAIDYTWKSQKDSIMIQLKQGQVVTKIQSGLGSTSVKQLTLDQYNQIKSGMTFQQAVDILGQDYREVSNKKSDSSILRNVEWVLPDSTNIKIYMQDEKIIHKATTIGKKK